MKPELTFMILTLSIHLISLPNPCVARFVCSPCENDIECDMPPPMLCRYGEVRDACNRRECAKGPGGRCGGPMNILGQCGNNLMCHSDEICHGWFLDTMEHYK